MSSLIKDTRVKKNWRPFQLGTAAICVWLVTAGIARAQTVTAPNNGGQWQLAIGVSAGGWGFDQAMADFRWDITPSLQSGVDATFYRGRLAAGIGAWRANTTQDSGIPGETTKPTVNLTGVDLVGQFRLIERWGAQLWGTAHVGRLHLSYDPDQLTFDTGGVGGVITVDYKPISEWDFGLGAALRSELTRHMALSLQATGTTFALDTAHRRGNEIIEARERFYNWSLRLQVSWLVGL